MSNPQKTQKYTFRRRARGASAFSSRLAKAGPARSCTLASAVKTAIVLQQLWGSEIHIFDETNQMVSSVSGMIRFDLNDPKPRIQICIHEDLVQEMME